MIFSTLQFILVFLPIVLGGYSLLLRFANPTYAKAYLVFGSLYFYWYGAQDFFLVFCISLFANYLLGLAIIKAPLKLTKRLIMLVGVLVNLGLLGYYKYFNFFIGNINFITGFDYALKNIILPIGISFYSFQVIAHLVDCYQGKTTRYTLLDYLLFILFFPQLIVGPIVHHSEVVPQFQKLTKHTLNAPQFATGIFLFALGCTKKLMLADPLTIWAQRAFDSSLNLGFADAWLNAVSYTLSYYFDLSGYADMALGIGLMFGITLCINFNSPYKATDFAEYWRRWHMSLSRFLGDYIFRNMYDKTKGSQNFFFALFITFLVSGFWHGAGWTFIVWGIINGIFVMMAHAMRMNNLKMPFLFAWLLTFAGVVLTRVLFVSEDFTSAFHVLSVMFGSESFALEGNYVSLRQVLYVFIGMAIVLAFPNSNELAERFKPNHTYLLATTALILLGLFNITYVRGFLYFQF